MIREKGFRNVIYAINNFLHYIAKYLVILYTNNANIKYLMNKPITNGKITIWLLLMHEFNITVLD